MSNKQQLRAQRVGTVINLTSKKQEERVGQALFSVVEKLETRYGNIFHHEKSWKLKDVVEKLRNNYPEVDFHYYFDTSTMRPDGGILSVRDIQNNHYPILIVEVKNQGTNTFRKAEGKPIQAKGNAIERLGKNVIGFRAALLGEKITPFVCFGDGCDFSPDSSILDRVVTIAMFGNLNKVCVLNQGNESLFNRGSFFFREEPWEVKDMSEIMFDIAKRSIYYYFSKYGEHNFINQ